MAFGLEAVATDHSRTVADVSSVSCSIVTLCVARKRKSTVSITPTRWSSTCSRSTPCLYSGLTRQGGYAQYCYLRAEACSLVPHDMRLDWPSMTAILGAGTTIFSELRLAEIKVFKLSLVDDACPARVDSLKELDMTPGETIAIHAAG